MSILKLALYIGIISGTIGIVSVIIEHWDIFYLMLCISSCFFPPHLCPYPDANILDCPCSVYGCHYPDVNIFSFPCLVYGGELFDVKVNWSDIPDDWDLVVYMEDGYTQLADNSSSPIDPDSGIDMVTLQVYPTTAIHDQADVYACFYDEDGELRVSEKKGIRVYPIRVKIINCTPQPVHGGENLCLNISWYNMTDDWNLFVSLVDSQNNTLLADGGPSNISTNYGEDTFTLDVYERDTPIKANLRAQASFCENGERKAITYEEKMDIYESKPKVHIKNCSSWSVHGGERLNVKVNWEHVPLDWELKLSLEKTPTDHTPLAHGGTSKIDHSNGEKMITLKVFQVTEIHEQAQVCACFYKGTEGKIFDKKSITVKPMSNSQISSY